MKLLGSLFILNSSLVQDVGAQQCPDYQIGQQCDDECSTVFFDCRNNCNDHLCENKCLAEFGDCVSDCPCGLNCPDGCVGCAHPLCDKSCDNLETDFEFQQCKVKALQGFDACALDCLNNWYCIDACYKEDIQKGFSQCKCFDEIPIDENDSDHLTLLMDSYYEGKKIGYVTHIDGSYQEDRYYERERNSIDDSVNAIFQGEVYIFGSYYYGGRAIQIVNGCAISKISSELVRNVDNFASIVATSDGVYTCFRNSSYKWCQLFNGSTTRLIEHETQHDHESGCMAVLNGNPTAIGGDGGNFVETLRSTGWTQLESHIIYNRYGGCTTVGNNMITIGGEEDSSGAYMYNGSTGNWSKLGNLKGNHLVNTVIQLNGIIYSTTLKTDYYETTPTYWTTESPENSQGIERIELVGTEITSKMIAFTPSDYEARRPVIFPSDRYQCSTPPYTTTSYPIYSRAQEE